MKHIFIINPAAGAQNCTDYISCLLKNADLDIEYEIHTTTYVGEATEFIRKTLSESEALHRFYACGGDGTLNEVVNGVIGFQNAEVTVFPCGSGNDYVKYYGTADDFSDISELIKAKSHKVDVLKVGDRYAINAVHFGLDSYVLKTMIKVRRNAILGKKRAYTTGVIAGFIGGMKTYCSLKADSKSLGGDKILLCTLANGKYVGGSYKSAPLSLNNDGLIEVLMVNPISRFRFLTLMNAYKRGEHLEDSRFDKYLNYTKAKKIEITAPTEIPVSIDGELLYLKDFTVEIVESAVNFVAPAHLTFNNKTDTLNKI